MFRGTFEHTIDDKGRVSVPAKFRDKLLASNDDRVVITTGFFGVLRCLDVYTHAAWLELEERLKGRPQFDPDVMRFKQFYLANAQDCQIDKQGRILVPPTLRSYAALRRDVNFVGIGENFQIWDRQVRNGMFGEVEQAFMNNPRLLTDVGI